MHKVVKICIENDFGIHTLLNYCNGLELVETDGVKSQSRIELHLFLCIMIRDN